MAERIGIIGAMAEEVELLHAHMKQERTTQRAGIVYVEGTFQSRSVVVCKSGVGKVNAAVCTQVLIDRFGADAVVFTGVAGALDPALEIGDIVVSSSCLQHDMDVTALGFPLGAIPYQDVSDFPADPQLTDLARRCAEQATGRVVVGRVLSGDQFVADRDKVAKLHLELGGVCTEMEGAAVAQVCAMNGVPYVVIRSMSDKADGSASVNFATFARESADRSYAIVSGMLQAMGE
ncbi:5'-methylthioadenosine/adenosylhomocysteine nucleosidase [Paenibacillus cymbidii]|uniref:5'-methylthioadenosine/adenosylhomocysteine nucleosidase n=1 Tax=Paenibacillus cymbidii TaxID=1639034 RepID=UPI00107FD6CF|nr:5'-methylthioadenosine/adenosylhomocysteine nucleosidase [Paenibacillus cymbidii]